MVNREPHRLAFVAELLELIFRYLDYLSLLQMQQVCKFWRDCVSSSSKVLQLLYKMPIPMGQNEDPHFEQVSLMSKKYPIPRGPHAGESVLELYLRADEQYLLDLNGLSGYMDNPTLLKNHRRILQQYRGALRGVRFPHGWPVGLREIHCYSCDGFHRQFRAQHLHPLLRFLDDTTLCLRGCGSHLFLNTTIITSLDAPETCYRHYCDDVKYIAKSLTAAFKAMEVSRLQHELLAQPICTRLVLQGYSDSRIVSNDRGVTLSDALSPLTQAFRREILDVQRHLHLVRASENRAWTLIPNHLGQRDWEFAVSNYEVVGVLFDDTLKEVNELMQVLEIWKETPEAI
jgi:hypothetical protein